jgi:hypothetical protein
VHLLVLAAMGMMCLPCALHLVLLPRRGAWAQLAVVSAAMLAVHPLLVGEHDMGHHSPAPAAIMVAMVTVASGGLALAVWALALDTLARRARA